MKTNETTTQTTQQVQAQQIIMKSDSVPVNEIRDVIKNCNNHTSLSKLEEKEREEAEEKKFIEELNVVKSLQPVTAFVLGMIKAGESDSDLAGIIADRMMNNITSHELVARAAVMCYANEHEDSILEGLIETLQTIVDLGVTDAKITGILELLEVVWHNC